ncbi:MAG: hypothetical protein V4724_37785 [Pseudomonadota bacterium]
MKTKRTEKKNDVVQQFRKTIHQARSPRIGLTRARARIDPSLFPQIVSTLGQQSIYKGLFALSTFPNRPDQLISLPRLGPISEDGEFLWTACVLKLFANKIHNFVKMKENFYSKFVNGEYSDAEIILELIEKEFGISLWLIQYKLQLFQLHKGLESQKNYVETILSTEGINSLSAWVCYFFSLRSEANVSFAKLNDELLNILPSPGLGEYVLNHILPYDLTAVREPQFPVSWEEPNPIIDRFETLVSMLQIKLSRERKSVSKNIALCLRELNGIGDIRLRRLDSILAKEVSISSDSALIKQADSYTSGHYSEVDVLTCESLELIARASIFMVENQEFSKVSIRGQMIASMREILILSPHAQQHRLSLKKIALTCPKHEIAIQAASFLERDHDYILTEKYSDLEYLATLNGSLENPWSMALVAGFENRSNWVAELSRSHPKSMSINLRKIIYCNGQGTSIDELSGRLPLHRLSVYKGHIEISKNNLQEAIHCYTFAAKHANIFVSSHAKRYLYDALYADHRYKECLNLIIDHVLLNPSAVFAYRINELVKVCLEKNELLANIDLAILLHLNVVHVHPRWEKELSDIFENVLYDASVSKPSELFALEKKFDQAREVYFLRNICTPRFLGDTTCFSSVDEIEEERIAICQHLLSIDSKDKEEYLSEIRGITRDINVAHLLKKVQASKIYVDEAGLRQSFETTLLDTFLRYQKLLESPVLAYKAEKLSKRLEEMLTMKGSPEIKELKLPASEQHALFETLRHDFCVEFAYSPAYGLDTHVSTTIRHGAFEGHIRTPFASEDLLCKKRDKEFILPKAWASRLDYLNDDEQNQVRRILGRFTTRIEELISEYLVKKIQVRENGNDGMFIFEANEKAIDDLRGTITKATDYNAFLERFFEHAWQLVDESMEIIRYDLNTNLLKQVNSACDALILGCEQALGHDKIIQVVDAVVRSQTAFQSAVVEVAEWFRRPQDLSRDPFDFEVAVHVALQQVKNCYVKTPLEESLKLNVPEKIEGKLLDGICEIFFILLQNVILHSGLSDQVIPVFVSADRIGDTLVVSCRNELSSELDLEIRKQLAKEAIKKYEGDTALRLARVEGGSGLSKIWRIAEFDLRVGHKIDIKVGDDRTFTTIVTFSDFRVIKNADIHR